MFIRRFFYLQNFKLMETQRFYLREITNSDIDNVFKGLSNPAITRYYDVHFDTLEATKEQMNWYADLKKNGTGLWWAVIDKSTDQFCGAGGYNGLEKTHQKAEIGFWLLQDFWGKGIMKEVMPKLFELGFNDLNLNRIEGFVINENAKCKRAIEKINFKHEGTMRESEIKNGQKISVDIYAILKSDWLKVNV